MKSLQELTRPNIWNLSPYSCARNEFKGTHAVAFLDANESPYNPPYNRYPDPLQAELKQLIARLKGIPAKSIFLGNGSDEAIDLVYRCFCEPGKDNVVAIAPTYGMYRVCADINNVEYRSVDLDPQYQLSADHMLQTCDSHTKVVWLCSPNNPTGNNLDTNQIEQILREYPGIVVIDEAYADFSAHPSFRQAISQYPHLIVLQTLSKAWASAALRVGMAFASADIIAIFNKVKYPYNINLPAQREAIDILNRRFEVDEWVRLVLLERGRLMTAFRELPFCLEVFPTDANFFLARVNDAQAVYDYLVNQGIIVRNRANVRLCEGCLRITIGTKSENAALLSALRQFNR
ncbi:MAG: histidinol-phosphate transaminase [Prevotella sp.]|nr:histidinol-phosphate transaminase [Prevotella sp.]